MSGSDECEIGGGPLLRKKPRTCLRACDAAEANAHAKSTLVLRVLLDDGSHRWEAELRRCPKEDNVLLEELEDRRRLLGLPSIAASPLQAADLGCVSVSWESL